ncbi:signal recognition particle 72 kDa subunit [Pelomyxa schiedti]|nr:signal recognition particle 72 kDa subunit [Pelomyxa schiedti]
MSKATGNAAEIAAAFVRVSNCVAAGDAEGALEASEEVLAMPGCERDRDATMCKVVSLISLGKLDDALAATGGTWEDNFLVFERAYCLYRAKKTQEALDTLSPLKPTTQVLLLKAQILYKLEKFSECVQIYEQLLEATSPSTELVSNLCAACVQAGDTTKTQQIVDRFCSQSKFQSAYEISYNTGCHFAYAKQWDQANEWLQKAKTVCTKAAQTEGVSQVDIDRETAQIDAQLGYVLQMQGKVQEALELYNSIATRKTKEEVTAMVNHNIQALEEAKRRSKAATTKPQRESDVPAPAPAPAPSPSQPQIPQQKKAQTKVPEKKVTAPIKNAPVERKIITPTTLTAEELEKLGLSRPKKIHPVKTTNTKVKKVVSAEVALQRAKERRKKRKKARRCALMLAAVNKRRAASGMGSISRSNMPQLDPERWIPKRDRKLGVYAKQASKRAKQKQQSSRGTQGSLDSEAADAITMKASSGSGASASPPTATSAKGKAIQRQMQQQRDSGSGHSRGGRRKY